MLMLLASAVNNSQIYKNIRGKAVIFLYFFFSCCIIVQKIKLFLSHASTSF